MPVRLLYATNYFINPLLNLGSLLDRFQEFRLYVICNYGSSFSSLQSVANLQTTSPSHFLAVPSIVYLITFQTSSPGMVTVVQLSSSATDRSQWDVTQPTSTVWVRLVKRPFAASHSRGTKPPCWREEVVLGQDKKRNLPFKIMYVFCLSCSSATLALQKGGFVPREWLAAKGLFRIQVILEIYLVGLCSKIYFSWSSCDRKCGWWPSL